jgi:hypothetical protein
MSTSISTGYDAAEAARLRAEEEARKRAEERARKLEEEKKAREAEEKARKAQEAKEEQEKEAKPKEDSVFDDKDSGLKTQEVQGNDEWVKSLQARGLRTTGIHDREANFEDYGNALSTELQQMILNSFDNEQDYKLQAELAKMFSNTNYHNFSEVMAACRQLGISVSRESVHTTYIHDNKYDGRWNKTNAQNGSITVFTFSDGKGGEIKIADTNGNGALETEELFINEILSGIASDLQVSKSNMNLGGKHGSANGVNRTNKPEDILKNIFGNSQNSFNDLVKELQDFKQQLEEEKEEREAEKRKGKIEVSQSTFNRLVNNKVQEYMEEDSLSYSVAYNRAIEKVSEKYVV